MAMVAPAAPVGGPQEGPQTAFTYSSEPQAVPPKRSARSNYGGNAAPSDAAQWMDENEVCIGLQASSFWVCPTNHLVISPPPTIADLGGAVL